MADTDGEPEVSFTPADDTPPAEKTPETPPAPTHDDSLRETVARLEGVVTGLAARVEQIVTQKSPDEAPISKPWTHRNFG